MKKLSLVLIFSSLLAGLYTIYILIPSNYIKSNIQANIELVNESESSESEKSDWITFFEDIQGAAVVIHMNAIIVLALTSVNLCVGCIMFRRSRLKIKSYSS